MKSLIFTLLFGISLSLFASDSFRARADRKGNDGNLIPVRNTVADINCEPCADKNASAVDRWADVDAINSTVYDAGFGGTTSSTKGKTNN